MTVEQLVDVLRTADGDDPALAAATQLRVRRSLETRARGRHQVVGLVTALAILFGGTVSWALVNGEVAALWAPAPVPAPRRDPPAAAPRPVPRPRQALISAPRPELPPETVPPPGPASPPPPALPPPAAAPVASPPPRRPIAQPVEVLYRRAHDLHFHGGDPAATLAAWDAYLAAEPDGRFAIEARYNRGLLLVRLARYPEARAALLPFARGELAAAGYRQPEAEQLVERLARFE
jgi:hypothetical protein